MSRSDSNIQTSHKNATFALDAMPIGASLSSGPFRTGRLHILERERAVQRAQESRQGTIVGLWQNEADRLSRSIEAKTKSGMQGHDVALCDFTGDRSDLVGKMQDYLAEEEKYFILVLQDAAHVYYAGEFNKNIPASFSPSFVSASHNASFTIFPCLDLDAEPLIYDYKRIKTVLTTYYAYINASIFRANAPNNLGNTFAADTSMWEEGYRDRVEPDGNPHWIHIKEDDTAKNSSQELFPDLLVETGIISAQGRKDLRGRKKVKRSNETEVNQATHRSFSFGRIARLIFIGCILGCLYLILVQKGCMIN